MNNEFVQYLQDFLAKKSNETYAGALIYCGSKYLMHSEDKNAAAQVILQGLDQVYIPADHSKATVASAILNHFNAAVEKAKQYEARYGTT